MTQFVQRQPPRRAPRANLGGTVSAVIRLQNGRLRPARLQLLSITGGLLEIASYLEERTWVELSIYLSSGTVHATAEMMFPMCTGQEYRQPFRFTSLSSEELHKIDQEVTQLVKNQSAKPKLGDLGLRAPRYYLESW